MKLLELNRERFADQTINSSMYRLILTGDDIYYGRQKLGLSQDKLAKMMGKSRPLISRYERLRTSDELYAAMSVEDLLKLSNILLGEDVENECN